MHGIFSFAIMHSNFVIIAWGIERSKEQNGWEQNDEEFKELENEAIIGRNGEKGDATGQIKVERKGRHPRIRRNLKVRNNVERGQMFDNRIGKPAD